VAQERKGGRPPETGAKLSEVPTGEVRQITAKAVGTSHGTLSKARLVVHTAKDEEAPEPVRAAAKGLSPTSHEPPTPRESSRFKTFSMSTETTSPSLGGKCSTDS